MQLREMRHASGRTLCNCTLAWQHCLSPPICIFHPDAEGYYASGCVSGRCAHEDGDVHKPHDLQHVDRRNRSLHRIVRGDQFRRRRCVVAGRQHRC